MSPFIILKVELLNGINSLGYFSDADEEYFGTCENVIMLPLN